MASPLLRTAALFTGSLLGGAVGAVALGGVAIPVDILIEAVFANREAAERRDIKTFIGLVANDLSIVGPRDERTLAAVCNKVDPAIQRFGPTYSRLAEFGLNPAKATGEVAPHLHFTTKSERTELEIWCLKLIRHFYERLPRHAALLNEMLPELWTVLLRRIDSIQDLATTMAANDTERNRLQAEVNALQANDAIRDLAIVSLLQDIGERIGDRSSYPDQLRRAGERYRTLLAESERPRNLAPEFETIRQQVAVLIRDGLLDDAEKLLSDLSQRMATWREQHQAMLHRAQCDEAAILGERALIAEGRLRYRDAAVLHANAADLTDFDPGTSWHYRCEQGNMLLDHGREFGDNNALTEAIAVYEQTLSLVPRSGRPYDWARVQNNLGNALRALGEREHGTKDLERAVEAYELALLVRRDDDVPDEWAMTQNNLGATLAAIGKRESGTSILERAVEAYERALTVRSLEHDPDGWATTRQNLGTALAAIGERENGTLTLQRAVDAYEDALIVRTRKRASLSWALTKNNIGDALRIMGERQEDYILLECAVKAFEDALLEYKRERVPLDWAMTCHNLGITLFALAIRKDDINTLRSAIQCSEQALLEYDRDRVPRDWAMTKNALGNALAELGNRLGDTELQQRAIEAFDDALRERGRDIDPLSWSDTQLNIALTWLQIGRRTKDSGQLRLALEAIDGAIDEFRKAESTAKLATANGFREEILAELIPTHG